MKVDTTLVDLCGLDVAPLVPDVYAQYRPLVADALMFFVQRLPPETLGAIMTEQESLPADASMSRRFASLIRHCPTLHKLGQVVARDRRLAPALRKRLQTLESMESVTPVSQVRPFVERELGNVERAGIRLAGQPLAEASVAVVVPFTVDDTAAGGGREGVLKILKAGIEERLEAELALWSDLGTFIDERCVHYNIPSLRYSETLETVRDLLFNEIRLDREQDHLQTAAGFFKDVPMVHIPQLLPYCTPRITAMERIHGHKVTEVARLSEKERLRLSGSVIDALVARPVWNADANAMFHADPHAGNLFYTQAGRLAILDWSLVGRLAKTDRENTMQVMLGGLTFDTGRIVRAIAALARTAPDLAALRQAADRAITALYPVKLPGFRWLTGLMDDAMLSAGVRFSENMLLFRKGILTIEGVLADVWPGNSLDRALPLSAVRQFFHEWPSRPFATPTSREFGTHVSNLDLLSLYWSVPSKTTRFWVNFWKNRLSSLG